MIEKSLPHSIEAEQAVLGVYMLNKQQYIDIASEITASDFYEERHRLLFEVVSSMYDKEINVDLVTIANELEHYELQEKVRFSYVAELMTNVPLYCAYPFLFTCPQ